MEGGREGGRWRGSEADGEREREGGREGGRGGGRGSLSRNFTPLSPPRVARSHPGGNLGANLKSISHRCYLQELEFERELTKEPYICPWVASMVVWEQSGMALLHILTSVNTLGSRHVIPCHFAGTQPGTQHFPHLRGRDGTPVPRKVDVRLPGQGNSNSPSARPVHSIITKIQ